MHRPSSGRAPHVKHSEELLAAHADVQSGRVFRLRKRDRRGRLELRRARLRLRDDGLAVQQKYAPIHGGDRERPVERRRQPKRHLGGPIDERREPSRRVAAVRGLRWTAVAPFDRDVFA